MASRIDDRSGAAADRSWLRRHLAWAIAAKLLLLTLLYVVFFNPTLRPVIDGDAVGQRLHTPSR
jgi:hypothetical protein